MIVEQTQDVQRSKPCCQRTVLWMLQALRDVFSYKPPVTKDQFFTAGFAERKVIMSTDVLSLVRYDLGSCLI